MSGPSSITRFIAFLASGVAVALLSSRGVTRDLDARVHDALLFVKAHLTDPPGASRVRVFTTSPADERIGFTAPEVIAALRAFGSRESAAAVVSLPPLPTLATADADSIRTALFGLGRVLVVLDAGSRSVPAAARIDRIGRGPDLPPPPMVEIADDRVLLDLPALAIADLTPDPDGVIRRFAIAYGEHEATIPSLPVAIAARALHESSIRLARDLRTLESLGAADLHLTGPNELRFDLRATRVFAPRTLVEPERSGRERKRPPVRILAFSGSALARPVKTALSDERIGAELVADAVDDLLSSRTLRAPRPRTTDVGIVILTPLFATACSLPRSRRGRVLTGLSAGLVSLAVLAVATSSGILLSVGSFVLAIVLGAAVELAWRFGLRWVDRRS